MAFDDFQLYEPAAVRQVIGQGVSTLGKEECVLSLNKISSVSEAVSLIKDGMTVMVGGFLASGTPETLIDAVVEKGLRNITLICNDTGFPDRGIGKWVVNKNVCKVIVSHVGTNPETGRQMNAKELDVELVPQGTLIERIRCGGAGLGGVLTPTGIGTVVEEGKQKLNLNGREYLLEMPLRADVALVYGSKADKKGNIFYNQSSRNFNPIIAMSADLVIVEAQEIVEIGEIDPNVVMTPGVLVHKIVQGRSR